MIQRLTAHLVCFFMLVMNVIPSPAYAAESSSASGLNEVELFEKYPNAKVIRVSSDEYLTLTQDLQKRGYAQAEVLPLVLAQNDINAAETSQPNLAFKDDCGENSEESAGDQSVRVMVNFTNDMMHTGHGGSGDEAAVFFVIVGTVVVIVWALYIFKYLYDISLGNTICGKWNELTVVSSFASAGVAQHANFSGLRYATGFREGILDVGIGFELGRTDMLLSEIGVLELKGNYWLLGPILRWRISQGINPSYFQMNFVAGSTEHDEVGRLAKASLGLLFGLGESMQLGLNWGAMNINLNDNQGIISERSRYHYLYGMSLGFRF